MTAPFLVPSRSPEFPLGNNKSGTYMIPGCPVMATPATRNPLDNTDYYTPWSTETPIIVDQLAINVTTGGTSVRIGFYAANEDWQPVGPPMVDSGSIDISATGIKTYTPSTPIFIPPGRYLSVHNSTLSGSASYRFYPACPISFVRDLMGATGLFCHMSVSRTYAAFPTPGTPWDTWTVSNVQPGQHIIFYRVTKP